MPINISTPRHFKVNHRNSTWWMIGLNYETIVASYYGRTRRVNTINDVAGVAGKTNLSNRSRYRVLVAYEKETVGVSGYGAVSTHTHYCKGVTI